MGRDGFRHVPVQMICCEKQRQWVFPDVASIDGQPLGNTHSYLAFLDDLEVEYESPVSRSSQAYDNSCHAFLHLIRLWLPIAS